MNMQFKRPRGFLRIRDREQAHLRVVGAVLLVIVVGAQAASGVHRWTGEAVDAKWATPSNWQVRDDGAWRAAMAAPAADDHVRLGDATATDTPQTITLKKDARIGRLILSNTGQRSYTLTGAALTLRDAVAIEQSPDAAQHTTLRIDTHLVSGSRNTVSLRSRHAAHLVIARPLTVTRASERRGSLSVVGDGDAATGVLELRSHITARRVYFSADDPTTVLLNPPGSSSAETESPPRMLRLSRGMFSRGVTFLVQRDAQIDVIEPRGHTVRIHAHETGGRHVRLQAADMRWHGDVHVQSQTDASPNRLTLNVRHMGIENRSAGPRVELAVNTRLDLNGDQMIPPYADRVRGIHGEGGLIKSGGDEKISTIGGHNTYTGGTDIEWGGLRLAHAKIPASESTPDQTVTFTGRLGPGPLRIATGSVFDLNGADQTITGLTHSEREFIWPAPSVALNGGRLTINATRDSSFPGRFEGAGALIKRGEYAFTLSTSYNNPDGRLLHVADGLFAVRGTLSVGSGDFEMTGGRIRAGSFDAAGQRWRLTLSPSHEGQTLVKTEHATLDGAQLTPAFANGYRPSAGTRYTLINTNDGMTGIGSKDLFGHAAGDVFDVDGIRVKIDVHGTPIRTITLTVVGQTP